MAYTKNIWTDQNVERPKTYEVTNNQDGSITLTDSFGLVTDLGTPVNAVNMNHIEDGIEENSNALSNKANVDFSNVTDTADILMAHNAMPSNTYKTLTLGASGATYTVTADGWVTFFASASSNTSYVLLENITTEMGIMSWVAISGNTVRAYVPVKNGDVVRAIYYTITDSNLRFYYAVGSESEAS